MKAFEEFKGITPSFWAFIKFISETLGYTERRQNTVRKYTTGELRQLCNLTNTVVAPQFLDLAITYLNMRADLLNNFAKEMLMDAEAARKEYLNWEYLHRTQHYYCKLPLNKQKGEMKQVAFFTAIINILAEKTIREFNNQSTELGFDDDPRGLSFIWDDNRHIIGASSRRFDGAYPSIKNPRLIWEIKEYYYATTFGSRVADGVFETQLDGFEFKEIYDRSGVKVYHVLFIDAYRTWWEQGKSYLCRLVDTLNGGLVDEVIVGREVLTRWPELLKSIIVNA